MKLPKPFARRGKNKKDAPDVPGPVAEEELSEESREALKGIADLDEPDGRMASQFFRAVDKASEVQSPVIEKYVDHIQRRHRRKSVARQQRVIDRHFRTLATGTGAGTGALAFFPGIGTVLSMGAAGGEALGVVEVFALYTLASARLRGVDISHREARRRLILFSIAGAAGNDAVSAASGKKGVTGLRKLGSASEAQKRNINSRLGRIAFRQLRRRMTGAAFAKMLPLGIGAVLGARSNRKLAHMMIRHTHAVLSEEGKAR
ncbi:MAG: hypothetical protein ACTH2Y_06475 [Corynebacterium sp.]|uniref:hypothetical protein n=1 Tax=unclassified Corynebacterium TaxID=2624378 RepID=UPI002649EB92|nr:hypothetical protein [Corynebacterium sp.]MDN5720872.1 hypothetical protein [Corynebacterium sp.]MDN6258930.1 hypothetical protein [Corynebacterium sp.]MDN6325303.1 hypothetical protein [Corynebacterium sp.]MDN6510075.1 hypothetical protein [Corynebacterium sp.]